MDVVRVTTTEDIYQVLKKFDEYMPRLKKKVGDIFSYANKLNKNAYVLVAKRNDEILGFISFYANDLKTYNGFITLIVVSSNARRMGIGKALIDSSLSIMKEIGIKNAMLEVEPSNIGAIAFYECIGFEIIKENTSNVLWMKMEI